MRPASSSSETAGVDRVAVPGGAVLIGEQDDAPVGVEARRCTREIAAASTRVNP